MSLRVKKEVIYLESTRLDFPTFMNALADLKFQVRERGLVPSALFLNRNTLMMLREHMIAHYPEDLSEYDLRLMSKDVEQVIGVLFGSVVIRQGIISNRLECLTNTPVVQHVHLQFAFVEAIQQEEYLATSPRPGLIIDSEDSPLWVKEIEFLSQMPEARLIVNERFVHVWEMPNGNRYRFGYPDSTISRIVENPIDFPPGTVLHHIPPQDMLSFLADNPEALLVVYDNGERKWLTGIPPIVQPLPSRGARPFATHTRCPEPAPVEPSPTDSRFHCQ